MAAFFVATFRGLLSLMLMYAYLGARYLAIHTTLYSTKWLRYS